jgi:hypothetical protein
MSLPRRYFNINDFEDGDENGDLTYARKTGRSRITSTATTSLENPEDTVNNPNTSRHRYNSNKIDIKDRIIEELLERINTLEEKLDNCYSEISEKSKPGNSGGYRCSKHR